MTILNRLTDAECRAFMQAAHALAAFEHHFKPVWRYFDLPTHGVRLRLHEDEDIVIAPDGSIYLTSPIEVRLLALYIRNDSGVNVCEDVCTLSVWTFAR